MRGPEGQPFDWGALLRAGVQGLGLKPGEFWALTPAELRLLLGDGARPAMGRARLDELLQQWPDRPRVPVGNAAGKEGGDGRDD